MPRGTKRDRTPRELTPERPARLLELIEEGNHGNTARAVVGISRGSFYSWLSAEPKTPPKPSPAEADGDGVYEITSGDDAGKPADRRVGPVDARRPGTVARLAPLPTVCGLAGGVTAELHHWYGRLGPVRHAPPRAASHPCVVAAARSRARVDGSVGSCHCAVAVGSKAVLVGRVRLHPVLILMGLASSRARKGVRLIPAGAKGRSWAWTTTVIASLLLILALLYSLLIVLAATDSHSP
jgi:hypothetical protein